MQVQKINSNFFNNKINNKNITYKANYRTVLDESGKLKYRINTWFFRSDFDWFYFPTFIKSKYKNIDKVNLYDYGCSSGEEVYSLALKLLNNIEKDSHKFFPIIAKDIDEESIKEAKNGYLYVNKNEKILINNLLDSKTKKYFKFENDEEDITIFDKTKNRQYFEKVNYIKMGDKIKEKIKFSKGNILEDIDNIEPKNTILICRNFWPYLSPKEREFLIKKIFEKFTDDSSYLIIGDFNKLHDYEKSGEKNITELLEKYNFAETIVKNMYKKFYIN